MKLKRICQTCGKEFEVYKSSLEKSNSSGKFCCKKCYTEYQKTLTGQKNNHCTRYTTKCANCGKEVITIPSRAKIYKNRFCSLGCKYEYHHNYTCGEKNCNWKGGFSRYRGEDFEVVKKKYFKNSFCVLCGTSKSITIHHIIPYRLLQDNSLENLVPLCRRHHKQIEHLFVSILEPLKNYEITKFICGNIFKTYYYAQLSRRKNYGKFKN